jgi:lipid-A-disaccharide synthase
VSAKQQIFIVAGEASGDLHAANLINSISKIEPEIRFYGMGGARMRALGIDILVDINELAVIGFFDVLFKLPKIIAALHIIRKELINNPPDLLILVDYPGFNLKLAKIAHNLGIRVFYYISPKLWASRPGRAKIIKKYIDKMAVLFPFEVDFFKQFNISVDFVGNPLAEIAKPTMDKVTAKQHFGFNPTTRIIGLFPGSRKGEIKKLLPVLLKSARILVKRFPDLQFILPLASSLSRQDLHYF